MNAQKNIFLALTFFIGLASFAQTPTPHNQYTYTYDANGNRVERSMLQVMLVPKVANPNQSTTLPNGLTPEQIAAGATVSTQGVQLSAYPNPATQHITVNVVSQQEQPVTVAEARLYTANGSVQSTLQNPGNTFNVPLDGLAAGNYLLWLKLSNGTIERVRVVKM